MLRKRFIPAILLYALVASCSLAMLPTVEAPASPVTLAQP